jgi:hypothetical protein
MREMLELIGVDVRRELQPAFRFLSDVRPRPFVGVVGGVFFIFGFLFTPFAA